MKKIVFNILLLLFTILMALILVSCKPEKANNQPTYRIGYMICNSEQETLDRFLPLTAYLGEKMGVKFEAVAIDTLNYAEEFESLDFTHTNSLLYIMYNRYNGLDILAVEKRGELGARSKGLVVTPKKSGIQSVSDLKGKTMFFGPMLAPTGYMSQIYALKQQGFNVDDDLALYTIPQGSFKHEKVIYGVQYGKYDAGAFPYYDFEIMAKQGKINRDDFLVLAEGPLIPYCNFGVTQRVDDKLAQKFKETLLAITEDDMVMTKEGERVRVLERAQVQGYEDAVDSDFDIVRKMARETNMPPYQQY